MLDAGINSGDYILVQFTDNVQNGDRVAAIVGDMVTVKRLERRDGVTILYPETKIQNTNRSYCTKTSK